MVYSIEHETTRSMRLRVPMAKLEPWQVEIIKYELMYVDGVNDVTVYPRTGGFRVSYDSPKVKEAVLAKLSGVTVKDLQTVAEYLKEYPAEKKGLEMEELKRRGLDPALKRSMRARILIEAAADLMMPAPVQIAYHLYQLVTLKNL